MAPGICLDSYAHVVGDAELAEIRLLAEKLLPCSVQNVNSTAKGGGVAELLSRIVPLMRDLGLEVWWDVMAGDQAFFAVTKRLHNALHGGSETLGIEGYEHFRTTTRANAGLIRSDAEFVVIHDPQPLGLVAERGEGQKWIWRCHIDVSDADPIAWSFLRPFVDRYDTAIFHLPDYSRSLLIPEVILQPAIDPLDEKNRELPEEEVRGVLESHGIDPRRKIVLQVSRFDRLKDPVGVIEAYRIVRKWHDCQLVLAGGSADDDPEGAQVLAEVLEMAAGDPDIHVLSLPPDAHRTINALQRGATVVVQKSRKEGFGLVVTEAMWKGKPVIGAAVGGIRKQIDDGTTGFLVHSVAGCAYRLRELLTNDGLAHRLGTNARLYVRDNFLITRSLKNWLLVLHALRAGKQSGLVQLP